ncbi:MAG TPA: M50 family metallopeptidase [Chlamydiales bacterium]|nr:M50 family metallopeptidase [Chlamydiales bacterium]
MIRFGKRLPVRIHPFFWITAALLGYMISQSFGGMLIWMVIIFFSVLFHELGHALTAILFKRSPKIDLVVLGGLTSYDSKGLSSWKQFLITLNGPVFGILLFAICYLLTSFQIVTNPKLVMILNWTAIINIFWAGINLLPVLPLDGGQLLRIVLEGIFGIKGFKIALFIGMVFAFGISFFFFAYRNILGGVLFFLFGFQSFDMWRKSRYLSKEDRNDENAKKLMQGELLLEKGNKDEAKKIFENLRENIHEGMLYVAATHYLAMIDYEQGDHQKAYEMLRPIKDLLPDTGKCFLHKLAFEAKDYEIVKEYSSLCYQMNPISEVALSNAKACAYLKEAQAAGGWLQTATSHGQYSLESLLKEEPFMALANDPVFEEFIKNVK